MKRHTYLLVLTLFLCTEARSQQASSDEFPIGGLTFGTTEDRTVLPERMQELGINSIFYRGRRGAAAMPSGSRPFYDARGYFTGNFIGDRGGIPTIDWRYFLISREERPLSGELGFQYETQLTWPEKDNQNNPLRSGAPTPSGEYFIGAGSYLNDEQGNPFYLRHLSTGGDLPGLARQFYIDFIYRFKSSDYQGVVDPNTNLFELRVILTKNIGGVYTDNVTSFYITYADYLNYLQPDAVGRDPKYPTHAGEDMDLVTNVEGAQHHWPADGYAIIRMPFRLGDDYYPQGYSERKSYIPNSPNDDDKDHLSDTDPMVNGVCYLAGFDVQLRPVIVGGFVPNQGIFVLGARMRGKQTDDLLRGKLDYRLYERFQQIKDDITKPDYWDDAHTLPVPEAWSKVKTISLGNELLPAGFRALAYIEKKWREWTRPRGGEKRMGLILAHPYWGAYNFLRPIYKRGFGILPEAIHAENAINSTLTPGYDVWKRLLGLGARHTKDVSGWENKRIFPGDALRSTIKNDATFLTTVRLEGDRRNLRWAVS